MSTAPTRYIRANELVGRRVVTLAGDSDHEVQDLMLDPRDRRRIDAVALREPGLLGGLHKSLLPIDAVRAIGPDAVMVDPDAEHGQPDDQRLGARDTLEGLRVLTDDGAALGTITDAVVESGDGQIRLVAVELGTDSDDQGDDDAVRYLALPDDLVLSDEALIVPAAVAERVCTSTDDLTDAVAAARRTDQDDQR
jgi:sporulation protein YlmC with PRC-barrel domain